MLKNNKKMKQKIVITAREERFMQKAINFLKSVDESVESNGNYKERLVNRAINGMPWSNHNWAWSFLCSADEYKQAGFIHFSMPEDFDTLKAMYGMEKTIENQRKELRSFNNKKRKEEKPHFVARVDSHCEDVLKNIFPEGTDKTTCTRCDIDIEDYRNQINKAFFTPKLNVKPKKVVFTNSIGEQFTKKYLKKNKVYWVIKEGLIVFGGLITLPLYEENSFFSEIFKTEASAETWKKNYIAKQAKKGMKWNGKEFVEMKLSEMEYHAKDREDLRDVMMKLPIEILNEGFNTDIVYNFVSFSCGRINNFTKESHSGHNLTEVTKEVFINAVIKYICE